VSTALEGATEKCFEVPYKPYVAARDWFNKGFNVVAVRFELEADGKVSKKPLAEWSKWINQRQTLEEFEAQPWSIADGFGVVCSYPNNEGLYLAVVDYDVKKVSEEVKRKGGMLFERFPITRIEQTVSGGLHRIYLSRVKPRPISQYHKEYALELIAGPKLCVMAPSKGYKALNDNQPRIVEDAEELFCQVLGAEVFCQVLGVEDTRKINKDINAALLEKWLREILDSGKLKVAGEGANFVYCHCPFHPPDNHPSFAINKRKFYAVDFHDGKVYSLKELMDALQLSEERVGSGEPKTASKYLINLYEHRAAEQALMEAFKALEASRRLPKHISSVHVATEWVKRQRYICVEVGVHTPKDLSSITNMKVKAYFYVRNITSREVFGKDIPKLFRMNLPKDDLNRFILVAPQLPTLSAEKFYKDVKRLKISVWETFKAYKIKGNRSKWARRIAKQLEEVEQPQQLAEALASRVYEFLRYCVKPFLDLLRKLYPETAELIAASIQKWWEGGLDIEKVFAKDRGPPSSNAYMCKMR
jgi:hypothetical protein